MPAPLKLQDFIKVYDGLKPKLKRFESQDVQRAWNDIGSYVDQIDGALANLVEAVADAQDQGIKGTSLRDYLHDKEVKLGLRDFEVIFARFLDQMKLCRASAADAVKLGDDLKKLRKDIGQAFGQRPTGPDAKKITDLSKAIEGNLAKIDTIVNFARAMPELEKTAKGKDKLLEPVVGQAKAAPRKPEKPLPKELRSEPAIKALRAEISEIFDLANGKSRSREKPDSDELEEKLKRLEQIEAMLRGAVKDCRRTLKQAGQYDMLSSLLNDFQMPRTKLKKMIKGAQASEDGSKGRA